MSISEVEKELSQVVDLTLDDLRSEISTGEQDTPPQVVLSGDHSAALAADLFDLHSISYAEVRVERGEPWRVATQKLQRAVERRLQVISDEVARFEGPTLPADDSGAFRPMIEGAGLEIDSDLLWSPEAVDSLFVALKSHTCRNQPCYHCKGSPVHRYSGGTNDKYCMFVKEHNNNRKVPLERQPTTDSCC